MHTNRYVHASKILHSRGNGLCAATPSLVLQSKVLRQHVYHIYTYTRMYTYIAGGAICIFQMMYLHFLCVEDPLEIQGDFERTLSPNMISDTPVDSHHTSLNRETGNKLYLTIYICVCCLFFHCFSVYIIYIIHFSHTYLCNFLCVNSSFGSFTTFADSPKGWEGETLRLNSESACAAPGWATWLLEKVAFLEGK